MRLVIALTALNLALLGFTVSAQNRSAGSGLMLADETAQPGVHMVARKGATHVTITK